MGGHKRNDSASRKEDPRGDLLKMFQEIKSKLDDESNKNNDRYNKMCENFDIIIKENKELKEKVKFLEKKVSEQAQDMIVLNEQVNSLLQERINNNILIKGVPEFGPADTVPYIVRMIFEELEIAIPPYEITWMKRIGVVSEGKRRPILIKLASNEIKWSIIRKKRSKQLNASMFNFADKPIGGVEEKFYIDEQLTRDNMHLFMESKKLKQLGFRYVWSHNGMIFCKKNDKDKIMRINNYKRLTELYIDMSNAAKNTGKRQKISPTLSARGGTSTLAEFGSLGQEEKRVRSDDAIEIDLSLHPTPKKHTSDD